MIEVHIPFTTEKVTTPGPWRGHWNIGAYYNRAMAKADDWVIFADDDTYRQLLPPGYPSWFEAFAWAIAKQPKAGMITCKASRIGNRLQQASGVPSPQPFDLEWHRRKARAVYDKSGGLCLREVHVGANYFSGFLFATSKQAWKKAGGFREGFIGVDVNYGKKLQKAGLRSYMLMGLYVFHGYRRVDRKEKHG